MLFCVSQKNDNKSSGQKYVYQMLSRIFDITLFYYIFFKFLFRIKKYIDELRQIFFMNNLSMVPLLSCTTIQVNEQR